MSGDAIESSCIVLSVGDRIEDGVPTLELWSLVGEMDLARSRVPINQSTLNNATCAMTTDQLSGLAVLFVLE